MKATFTSAVAKAERDFECTLCGHRTRAVVSGIGEGAQSSLNSQGTAEKLAKKDAVAAIDRNLAVAECPKCKRRNPAAVRAWKIRRALPLVVACGGIALLGWVPVIIDMDMKDPEIAGWVMTGIAVFLAIPFWFTHVAMGWHAASHAAKFPHDR